MSERKEVIAKIAKARKILQDTAKELRAIETLKYSNDIADMSNDAYRELVAMLHKLNDDYCIEALTEDALDYEADE